MGKRIKIIRLQKSCLPRRKYRKDMPGNCRNCQFWRKASDDCMWIECWYLLPEKKQPPEDGEAPDCTGCPYGRDRPCIGYCIDKLWREVIEARRLQKEGP